MKCYGLNVSFACKEWLSELPDEVSLLAQLKLVRGKASFRDLYCWNDLKAGQMRMLLARLVKEGLIRKRVESGDWYDGLIDQKTITSYYLTEEGKRQAPSYPKSEG